MGTKKTRARKAHDGIRLSSLSPEKRGSGSYDGNRTVAELAPVFAYQEIPDEVLSGTELDLSMWSVVASDACLVRLARRATDSGAIMPGTSQKPRQHPNQLADLLPAAKYATAIICQGGSETFTLPRQPLHLVVRINLAGADQITDKAVQFVGDAYPGLKHLNLERAVKASVHAITRYSGVIHLISRCRKLESLNLSYVTALQSAAIGCIGELQLPLRSLAVAGCIQIPDYALLRVFQACSTLESLDLSFCGNVTDNVLMLLGKSGCRLRQLKLRGCRQISDTGVVALANSGGINNLVLLDLARFDLQYRLNDISLLALAESCLVLQTLNLSGCEMLTDVGMDWLASGCSALTHLDVSGCTSLSDLSLRAISESMLQLRHLNIRHCARISDLGMRHLSLGCPELTFLDAGGLPFLSDSHSDDLATAPASDDIYRQGIAALVGRCFKLRHLDLSSCTSISDGTLRCIAASCPGLVTLVLSGCYRVTPVGLSQILANCRQLASLNVAECDKVTDRSFFSIARHHQKHLRPPQIEALKGELLSPVIMPNRISILRLRGCIQLSDVTLKWLSKTSPLLRELDLSGCVGITDMGLLTLIESPISTTLRRLWLRNLSDITETGLSWLADKCPKLLLLDLTGCRKIPSYSIKSLCWKFAVYTDTNQFRGMAPRHRAEDWLFIEEYGNCWHSAIQIQCMYRARVARRIARQKREEQLILWVATRLQSVYRGRQARKYAVVCRFQFDKETHAAKQIQTAYRRLRARREAQRLRDLRYQHQVRQAAMIIQGAWRRKKLRERVLGRHLRRLAHEDKLRRAAVQIQRHWRGKKARTRSRLLLAEKLLRDREAFESAQKMQNLFRARVARHEANRKREELKNEQKRRERAAATLQAQIRRRRRMKELKAMRSYVAKVNTAAGRIQRWWRSKKRFLANQILLLAQRKRRLNDAAVKLQAAWKRRKGRIEVKLLRLAREMQQQQLEAAALRVQLNWRGRHGRLKAQEAKNSAMEKLLQQLKVQHDAVTLVQAHFRGQKGREKYREAQLLKKQRWKEIVRPENGEKFYYNKVTGEVRFRRPQDLLDLLPRPQCENCAAPTTNLARVECKDCGEVFCDSCWTSVHAGGRRKLHEFRALYDYYNKRMDYGDDEFPSRWPSEIEQDEKDGWGLRIYPRRKPEEVQGSWERYVDAETNREWFYNKDTEQNSYIPPEPFASERNVEWVKYYDEVQSVHYYFNTKTQESTFTRPPAYFTPRLAPASAETAVVSTQDGWEKYVDPLSGSPYYYNRWTMESVLARPLGFTTVREAQDGGVEPIRTGLSDWAKYLDASTGSYYYFNSRTNENTIQRPYAFVTPRMSAKEAGMGGSAEFFDPSTGKTYYFNQNTTECRQADAASSPVGHGSQ